MIETHDGGDGFGPSLSGDVSIETIRLIAAAFRREDDWAHQSRAVYDGKTLEKELDELFPVEVGLQALAELKKKQEEVKKVE